MKSCLIAALLFALVCEAFSPIWAKASEGVPSPQQNYKKAEYHIPMRDGVELYTAVYSPRESDEKLPFMMKRTCYSCRPYGPDQYPRSLGPSSLMQEEGFIFVYQDVRGRYMSDGKFDNMRPHVPGDDGIDESSDTFDSIEWLLENVDGHNGKVGIWGISYPGFYAAASLPEAHPALAAVSPQAPIADFYFDDFHHNGAYTLAYFMATPVFGYQKSERTRRSWYPRFRPETKDGYEFYLEMGSLKNGSEIYGEDCFFWNQLVEHPNYDEFWQARNLLPHLKKISPAVMTVGGWFDAEDLYGPLNIYRTIEENNPNAFNMLVMGPWSHGAWARSGSGRQTVGDMAFGVNVAAMYQEFIELPFFKNKLKGQGELDLPEAMVYDTGTNQWGRFDHWPPPDAAARKLYFHGEERISESAPEVASFHEEFLSDPTKPVPYTEDVKIVFTPRKYMTDDQRFAGKRQDVLVFESQVLEKPVTLIGNLKAQLKVSTTGTDADWIVKLIDVLPDDHPQFEHTDAVMGGYQMLVRSEIMRGRFRNGFEKPEPFTPGEITSVEVPLQGLFHTFKKGHRILVQVQSSWFPLFDRNPQTFVENIYLANEEDFQKATHRVVLRKGQSQLLRGQGAWRRGRAVVSRYLSDSVFFSSGSSAWAQAR